MELAQNYILRILIILDFDKSETNSVYLSKLTNVVKNYVAQRQAVYDELIKKVNAIHKIATSYLFKKTDYIT